MSPQNPRSSTDVTLSASPDPLLPHDAHNPTGSATILFIHGAFSTRAEWSLVTPYLAPYYHLLIPDLPSHGAARALTPFSVPRAARLLAALVRAKALHGKAHVVGLSLGALVAIELAAQHPEVVNDVFVSGFEVFPPTANPVAATLAPAVPYAIWVVHRLENLIPRATVRWLMDGADIPRSDTSIVTLALCDEIVGAMHTHWWPTPWPARTLIVAAGKAGIIPSSDHPQDARRLAETGRERNRETIAVTHPLMRHPWDRQAPLLFAETARTWFEKEEIPSGFVKLSSSASPRDQPGKHSSSEFMLRSGNSWLSVISTAFDSGITSLLRLVIGEGERFKSGAECSPSDVAAVDGDEYDVEE